MSSLVARYDDFVVNNVSAISSVESSLRSITWFLPGRFKDADLASEALSTLLNVVTMYHDTLFATIVKNDPKYRPLIPFSLHTRFTTACLEKISPYKWLARALELIKHTELLIEMGLRRKVSSKIRWRSVVLLELIKAILRLSLLRITKKPVLNPPLPERDFDPTTLPPSSVTSSPTLAPSPLSPFPTTPEHLQNNHQSLPPHELFSNSHTSAEDYLLPKALSTSSVRPSLSLVQSLSSYRDWLAEIIYILRPLVYATLLSRDRRSTRPLVVALSMELLSRTLRRTPPSSDTLERTEYGRRDRDILWYLLRGSIWRNYTRPKLDSIVNSTADKPILGLVGALVQTWIPLIDDYYYYTAP